MDGMGMIFLSGVKLADPFPSSSRVVPVSHSCSLGVPRKPRDCARVQGMLPSDIRIIMSQYKDPSKPISIMHCQSRVLITAHLWMVLEPATFDRFQCHTFPRFVGHVVLDNDGRDVEALPALPWWSGSSKLSPPFRALGPHIIHGTIGRLYIYPLVNQHSP